MRVLSSERFGQILALSRTLYDFVILDSPPALHVADPVLLGRYCEYIVFVVQAGRLPHELIAEALRRFSNEDRAKMVTLLTRVKRSLLDRRDYYSCAADDDWRHMSAVEVYRFREAMQDDPFQVHLSRHLARRGHDVTHVATRADNPGPKLGGARERSSEDRRSLTFIGVTLGGTTQHAAGTGAQTVGLPRQLR